MKHRTTKSQAALWAGGALDEEWGNLIDQATTSEIGSPASAIDRTIDLNRHTVECSKEINLNNGIG